MTGDWTIIFWTDERDNTPVKEWLDDLNQEKFKAVSKELILLRMCGNRLRIPHSKPIDIGLFELREMRFGLRIYYCFDKGQIIILLAAGDKSSQKRDIKVARERLTIVKGDK